MAFTLDIDEIREGGLDYERALPREFLEEALSGGANASFHAVEPGLFKAHFDKLPGRVMMNGRIDATVQAPCKRCLAEVVRKSLIDVSLTWVGERVDTRKRASAIDLESGSVDVNEDGPSNASFSDTDVDTEPFDGEEIHLDPMIREQLLLNLPMDVLCKSDCPGLCVVCGQDLNERDCGHDRKPADPRWAALKDLKLPN